LRKPPFNEPSANAQLTKPIQVDVGKPLMDQFAFSSPAQLLSPFFVLLAMLPPIFLDFWLSPSLFHSGHLGCQMNQPQSLRSPSFKICHIRWWSFCWSYLLKATPALLLASWRSDMYLVISLCPLSFRCSTGLELNAEANILIVN
jgi:hypothetical protein